MRRELRFPTTLVFCRDSEIAPTKEIDVACAIIGELNASGQQDS